jgi:hypothetical protein
MFFFQKLAAGSSRIFFFFWYIGIDEKDLGRFSQALISHTKVVNRQQAGSKKWQQAAKNGRRQQPQFFFGYRGTIDETRT